MLSEHEQYKCNVHCMISWMNDMPKTIIYIASFGVSISSAFSSTPPVWQTSAPFPSSGYKNDENYIYIGGGEDCNDGASDGTDLLQVH